MFDSLLEGETKASAAGLAAVWGGTASVLEAASDEWVGDQSRRVSDRDQTSKAKVSQHEANIETRISHAREHVSIAAEQLIAYQTAEASARALAESASVNVSVESELLRNATEEKQRADRSGKLLNQSAIAHKDKADLLRNELGGKEFHNRSAHVEEKATNHHIMWQLTGAVPDMVREVAENTRLGMAYQVPFTQYLLFVFGSLSTRCWFTVVWHRI